MSGEFFLMGAGDKPGCGGPYAYHTMPYKKYLDDRPKSPPPPTPDCEQLLHNGCLCHDTPISIRMNTILCLASISS